MSKKTIMKAAAVVLIVCGVALAGYPLYLRAQTYFEERRLENSFNDYVPVTPVPEPEEPQEWKIYKVMLPKWEDYPPTRMEISAIEMETQVEAVDDWGVFADDIRQLPAYLPESVFPGEIGNVCIAGHRGGPAGKFLNLKDLEPGDLIILHTSLARYTYVVEKVFLVDADAVHIFDPLDYAGMTLQTCVKDNKHKRQIVRAKLESAFVTAGE